MIKGLSLRQTFFSLDFISFLALHAFALSFSLSRFSLYLFCFKNKKKDAVTIANAPANSSFKN